MTIDILPDDALIEIFSFYLVEASNHIEPWLPLVHVCRRWRSIVFASPRRLDVQVVYTTKRQVNVMLDTWPNLLIRILARGFMGLPWHNKNHDKLIAALEHTDRICQVQLNQFGSYELERFYQQCRNRFWL